VAPTDRKEARNEGKKKAVDPRNAHQGEEISLTKAWLGLTFLALVMGVLLFITAGTLEYREAWIYLGVFFTIATLITLYLRRHDPALLARRVKAGPAAEKEPREKIIMGLNSLGFIAMLVVPALDHRFNSPGLPPSLILLGNALTVTGFALTFRVFRENTYASGTIQTVADQKVISTGPYAVIRHPMYAGGMMILAGMPLALGSYHGFIAFGAMLPFLLWRLFDEEKFLALNLEGYADYCRKVRWRIIPGVF
jgi:protein-S-isoprenylcysteine O-methyltransferase Ste14